MNGACNKWNYGTLMPIFIDWHFIRLTSSAQPTKQLRSATKTHLAIPRLKLINCIWQHAANLNSDATPHNNAPPKLATPQRFLYGRRRNARIKFSYL
jgi:hypothetical protein